MIDRIKGGIEPENVKELWPGAIEALKAQRIKNPHNKPWCLITAKNNRLYLM